MQTLSVLSVEMGHPVGTGARALLPAGPGSGFRVVAAATAEAARDLLASAAADVVLLDCDYAAPDAPALLRSLRELAPGLPLVVVTPGEEAGLLALAEGAEECLAREDLTGALLERSLRHAAARVRARAGLRARCDGLERRVAGLTADLACANREFESLSYSVSHDLRAPLRAIEGFSLMLEEEAGGALDGEAAAHLARIREAGRRMAAQIEDLLRLSRVVRQELSPGPVDLSALAAGIVEELRREHPERAIEALIEPGLTAVGDRALLAIALRNLLDNAWKFTGKTAGARVEFGACELGGLPAYFVRDNGAGFDMAYARRLFGPFQRLHGADEFPGSGVGLAIAARIVHRHRGEIRAEGSPGQGATFTFTLGAAPVAPAGGAA